MNGIIVEGISDQRIIEVICRKMNLRIKRVVSMGGGQIENKKEVDNRIKGLQEEGCKNVIILVDAHKTSAEKRRKEIIEKLQIEENEIKLCIVNRCIESWLMGCFDEYPDSILDPVKEIEKLMKTKKGKNAKYKYIKSSDGPKIAEDNDLHHFKRSKSFEEFELKIRCSKN